MPQSKITPKRTRKKQYSHPTQSDRKWRKLSKDFLAENPNCASCAMAGKSTRATVTDHIFPWRKYPDRKYDRDNLQALCRPCHAVKTAYEKKGIFYDYVHRREYVIS